MHTIDFLPAQYRERNAKRRMKLWQLCVIALFGVAIGAAVIGQQFVRRAVQREVEMIDLEYAVALENEKVFQQTQERLNELHSTADLYAYLEYRWPRTQILRAIAQAQPDTVTLSELTISSVDQQQVEGGRRSPRRLRETEEDSDEGKQFPALRDLVELHRKDQGTDVAVSLLGVTTDPAQLHQFVSTLSEALLFGKAELVSLESFDDQNEPGAFEFAIRVVVQSQFSQPREKGHATNQAHATRDPI